MRSCVLHSSLSDPSGYLPQTWCEEKFPGHKNQCEYPILPVPVPKRSDKVLTGARNGVGDRKRRVYAVPSK